MEPCTGAHAPPRLTTSRVKEGAVGCLEPALAAARLDTCPAVALSKGFIPQLPALLSPIFRWLKDVAPGQGTIELPPNSIPGKDNQCWCQGPALQLLVIFSADPCSGPAPEVELKEIPSSCLRSGLHFPLRVQVGIFLPVG